MEQRDDPQGADDDLVLANLVEAFEEERRHQPDLTAEEWADRHPRYRSELLELLPGLMLMESVAAQVSEAAALEETLESVPDSIGEYRIVRRIGRGGMGVVFLAVQESLDREVALKVLPTTLDFDSDFLERFRREARVAGRLSHPHIVPVYGVGFADGRHYFAMRHIDGCALDEVVRRIRIATGGGRVREPSGASWNGARRDGSSSANDHEHFPGEAEEVMQAVRSLREEDTPLPQSLSVRGAVRIALQVADALAYAHGEGVLHRDIKPGNILVDERGDAWVTDFGLCRIEGAGNLTSEGAILGTLRYMAPEQIEGVSDERSDVYSLGLVLFELLALRPAFDSTRRAKIVHDVLHTSLPKLRKLRVGVPRAVETIIQKATAKLSVERYPTAAALARDLRAFLENRPISARRPSGIYLARLFVTRHRLAAATAVIALVMLTLLTALYVRDLRASQLESERRAYVGDLVAAEAALRAGSIQRAKYHLARAPEQFRAWEWEHLEARVDQSRGSIRLSDRSLQAISVSPDGARAAVAGAQGVTVIFLPGLEIEASLTGGEATSVSWNESGERLAVAWRTGEVEVFSRSPGAGGGDRATANPADYGTVARVSEGMLGDGAPFEVAMRDDLVLVGTDGGTVHLLDVDRWALVPLATLPGEIISIGLDVAATGRMSWWAVTGAGAVVMGTGGGPRDTDGMDVRGAQRRFDLLLGGDTVTDVALDPGAETGVLVTDGGAIFEFSTGADQLQRVYGSNRRLEATVLDGTTVLAVGRDQLVHLVDRAGQGRHRSLSGSSHALTELALVPGASQLFLTAGEDGVVRAWDRNVAGGGVPLLGHVDDVNSADVDPSGRLLATGGRDGQVIVWDLERAEPVTRYLEPRATVVAVGFLAGMDGPLFAATDLGDLHLWRSPLEGRGPEGRDAEGRPPDGVGPDGRAFHDGRSLRGAFVRDGDFDVREQAIVLGTTRGIVRLTPELMPREGRWMEGHDVVALAVDEGLDQLVGVTSTGTLFALDRTTGAIRYEVESRFRASPMGMSLRTTKARSGRPLGTYGTNTNDIVVFDRRDGSIVLTLASRAEDGDLGERLMGATFSPGGERVLVTTRNGLLSVWDSETGEHLVDLRGHDFWAMRALTSTASGAVVSVAADESVQVWETRSTQELADARARVQPLRSESELAAVRHELEPSVMLESIWKKLQSSGDVLPAELWRLMFSLYVRDRSDPLAGALYGLARTRFSPSAENRALLAFASERLPPDDPRQPMLRSTIAEYDRARLLADTTLIRGSVEGARLRPNPAVMRSLVGLSSFLPWGIAADFVRIASPLMHGARFVQALIPR